MKIANFIKKVILRKKTVHTFDNGVKVHENHIIPCQRKRYAKINLHEPEEENIFIRVINNTRKNGVFVNIGAAIGYYCFLARKLRPDLEIYAFNPHPTMQKKFRQNMQLNGIKNIIMRTEAISSRDNESMFIKKGYGDGIAKSFRERSAPVKTFTLNSFILSLNKNIDLVQMDIQGGEVNALNGADKVKDRIKWFLIGTHGHDIHKQCLGILLNYNFGIESEKEKVLNQPDGIILAKQKE